MAFEQAKQIFSYSNNLAEKYNFKLPYKDAIISKIPNEFTSYSEMVEFYLSLSLITKNLMHQESIEEINSTFKKNFEVMDLASIQHWLLLVAHKQIQFADESTLEAANESFKFKLNKEYIQDYEALSTINSRQMFYNKYSVYEDKLINPELFVEVKQTIDKYYDQQNRIVKLQDQQKKQKIDSFNQAQRDSLNRANKVGEFMWKTKDIFWGDAKRGKSLCSYVGNKMGFIEDVVEKKVKVLWKGKVLNQPDGFFFGNMNYSIMSKTKLDLQEYKYDPLNELTWVDMTDIAICAHSL